MSIIIKSTGAALPSRCITNDMLPDNLDTSDEWIRTRTGIKQRYACGDDESAFTLALSAAEQALDRANLSGMDIDLIIVATTSPNLTFPSVAVQVQSAIGMHKGAAFDVQAVCSGFIYGLSTAESFMRTNKAGRVLLIGTEALTRLIDWNDRSTAVLFGDGAGAIILEKQEDGSTSRGLIGSKFYSDGRGVDQLRTLSGIGILEDAKGIQMNGREVFKNATKTLSDIVTEILTAYNMDKSDIDWLVPHQANARIIEATAKHLNMPMSQVILTVGEHANTSAASIPLALNFAAESGKFKQGDLLLLEAFGAGFTWGAALIEWS